MTPAAGDADLAIDRYLADNSGAPLTRESLSVALSAVRADLLRMRETVRALDPVAREETAILPMREVEHNAILFAIRVTGSVKAAAELLEIGQATIYRRLAEYGLYVKARTARGREKIR